MKPSHTSYNELITATIPDVTMNSSLIQSHNPTSNLMKCKNKSLNLPDPRTNMLSWEVLDIANKDTINFTEDSISVLTHMAVVVKWKSYSTKE